MVSPAKALLLLLVFASELHTVSPWLSAAIPAIKGAIDIGQGVFGLFKSRDKVKTRRTEVKQLRTTAIDALADTRKDEQLRQMLQKLSAQGGGLKKIDLRVDQFVTGQARLQATADKSFARLREVGETTNEIDGKVDQVVNSMNEQRTLQLQQMAQMDKVKASVGRSSQTSDAILEGVGELGVGFKEVRDITGGIDKGIVEASKKIEGLESMANDMLQQSQTMELSMIKHILTESERTDSQMAMVQSDMNKGLAEMSAHLDKLSFKVQNEITQANDKVMSMGRDIKEPLLKQFLADIEETTREARECYRIMYERLTQKGQFQTTGLDLMLNFAKVSESKSNEIRVKEIVKDLGHPVKGILACWDAYRSIYNPATGAGMLRPRNVFFKLLQKWNMTYVGDTRGEAYWYNNTDVRLAAVTELKSFNRIGYKFTTELSTLYTWQNAYLAARTAFSNSEIDSDLVTDQIEKLMIEYKDESEILTKTLDKMFPSCPLWRSMEEALKKKRLMCDEQWFMKPTLVDEHCASFPANALPHECQQHKKMRIGSNCTFLCLDESLVIEPMLCTPKKPDGWHHNRRDFENNLKKCNKHASGMQGLLSKMNEISNEMAGAKKACAKSRRQTERSTSYYGLVDGEPDFTHTRKREVNDKIAEDSASSENCYDCPSGWLKRKQNCYKLFNDKKRTWSRAKLRCKDKSADLASILTKAEHAFIHKNVVEPSGVDASWIGLTGTSSKDLSWSDGSKVKFNKITTRAADASKNKKCAQMNSGGSWKSSDNCDESAAFICKQAASAC